MWRSYRCVYSESWVDGEVSGVILSEYAAF